MRTGSCKYGSNCRFNHPDPTSVAGADATSGYGNGGSFQLQGAAQTTPASWSSAPIMFPPTPATPQSNPEWNGYQVVPHPKKKNDLIISLDIFFFLFWGGGGVWGCENCDLVN